MQYFFFRSIVSLNSSLLTLHSSATLLYSTLLYSTLLYSTLLYSTLLYSPFLSSLPFFFLSALSPLLSFLFPSSLFFYSLNLSSPLSPSHLTSPHLTSPLPSSFLYPGTSVLTVRPFEGVLTPTMRVLAHRSEVHVENRNISNYEKNVLRRDGAYRWAFD